MKTILFKMNAICIIFLFSFSNNTSAQNVVKPVTADCYVKRTGTTAEAQTPSLVFKHSGATGTNRRIYLRFDLTGIDTTRIETAKISMYQNTAFTNISVLNLKLYAVSDNNWDETTVVDPGPAYETTPFADLDVDGTTGWKQSTNLASYLKKCYKENKSMNLAVFSSPDNYYSSNTLYFDSKEKVDGYAAKLEIVYRAPTGIINLSGENDGIKLHTKIVNGFINITLNDKENWQSISIQNINGQTIKEYNIAGQTSYKLDMINVTKGIFILKFTGNNKISTRKIINQ